MGKKLTVLIDEQIIQVEALAAYLPIDRIAEHIGVSPTTFYEIKKRQPKVFEAYQRGVAKAHVFCGQTLMGFIREKANTSLKLQATMFYLRTQGGWTEKQFVETKDVTPKVPPSIMFKVNEKPAHRKDG